MATIELPAWKVSRVWHDAKTLWPSGLRRWLKAPFRKGVGSNPTGVISRLACMQLWLHRVSGFGVALELEMLI